MKAKIKLHGIQLPYEAHTLITGQPGSGKTRSVLRPLMREHLAKNSTNPESKTGLLLLDPKGDMLGWTKELLTSIGRESDLVVIGNGEAGFNLFAQMPLSASQVAARLSLAANSISKGMEIRMDSEYWVHQQRQMIEALYELARYQTSDRTLQIDDICGLYRELLPKLRSSFEKAANKYPLSRLAEAQDVFRNFSSLPSDTRECVASTVANCLSVFRQSPLPELMNPEPSKSVDLTRIIQEGACVVVSCVSRSYGDSTLPLLQAIKESFADIILSRAELEVDCGNGWQRANQTRDILYVADEAHRVLKKGDSVGELDFLDTCREVRCRAILATQSIASLQSVMGVIPADRLVALCGNHFFLNNIDASTQSWADRMFCPKETAPIPPPLLMPQKQANRQIDWQGHQTLSTLKTGEFVVRTADGLTYRKKVGLKKIKTQAEAVSRPLRNS